MLTTPRKRTLLALLALLAAYAVVTQGQATAASTGTRWSSQFSDPQWLQVDLGATATIDTVKLVWETAYATGFQVQTSPDGNAWTTISSTTTGTGGTQT